MAANIITLDDFERRMAAPRGVEERVLPHDLDAERAVLGAAVVNPDAFLLAAEQLNVSSFYRHAHGRIFAAEARLHARGAAIDFLTLKAELGDALEDVGGAVYLAGLVDGLPRSTNVGDYAAIVAEKKRLRDIIHASTKAIGQAYDANMSAAVIADSTRTYLETFAHTPGALPEIQTLDALLQMADEPIDWSVVDIHPRGTKALLAAQFKAGKTSLVANYVRSKVDGDPFLGAFGVTPIDGHIVVLDFEMSQRQIKKWYRDHKIRRTDKVVLISMRGRVCSFNIIDPGVRKRWAALLRSVGASDLVVDCLRPIMDALGLDEHKDGGRLLVALDALVAEAGVTDLLVVHHMGHVGERSRGDSRFRDWPDVEWQLVRKTEEAASPRFFKAYGRDVSVPEGQLEWDATRRRLTLIGGSRQDAKFEAVTQDIVATIKASANALSGRAICQELRDTHPRDIVFEALKRAREAGILTYILGARNANLYQLGSVSGVSGECPADGASECPAAYIKPDTRTLAPIGSVSGGIHEHF